MSSPELKDHLTGVGIITVLLRVPLARDHLSFEISLIGIENSPFKRLTLVRDIFQAVTLLMIASRCA